MIALKVEKIGDRVGVILTEDALAALHLNVGDTLQLEPSGDGAFTALTREGWAEDPHARGRAFLRRSNKILTDYEGSPWPRSGSPRRRRGPRSKSR